MAEYLAAEVIEEHGLFTPLVWVEHYPEHEGEIGEYSLVTFSRWEPEDECLGGVANQDRVSSLDDSTSTGCGKPSRFLCGSEDNVNTKTRVESAE